MKKTALVFATLVILLSFALCQTTFAVEPQLGLESQQNEYSVSDLSRGYSRKRTHSEREGLKPLLVAIKH